MAFKVILEDGAVSIPKVIGTKKSDGTHTEVFQTWESGALVPESEVAPRLIELYEAGDLYTRSLIARVKSADDEEAEDAQKADPSAPVSEGGNEPVGVGGNPDDAVPANTQVDANTETKEDYNSYTVPVLEEKIGGRGLTIPTGAKKPDLVKILEDDDKAKGGDEENPFTTAA